MNRKSIIAMVIVLLLAVQVSGYVLMVSQLLGDDSLKGMDFISFYTAGRIAREGQYQNLFDLDAQREVQWQIVTPETFPGGVNLSQHPPYLAPLLSLIMVDDFVTAYLLWTAVRVAVMIVCAVLLWRFLRRRGWTTMNAVLCTLASITFFPFFLGLLGGQDTAFIMLGLLLWMIGLIEKRELQAGAGLALVSLSPLVVIALGMPLLAARRKAGLWFIVSLTALGLYSLAMVHIQGVLDFISLMRLSSQGEGYGLNQANMYNLIGLLLRLFPEINADIARIIGWTGFGLAVFGLVILWWGKDMRLRIESIGIAVVAAVFTLPHLHSHGLSYLLLPLLIACLLLYERGYQTAALLLIPVTSILLLVFIFLPPGLNFAAYYALMFLSAAGLWLSHSRQIKA
jgi:hypothetical protein